MALILLGVGTVQATKTEGDIESGAPVRVNTVEPDNPDYGAYPFHKFTSLGLIRAYQLLISPTKGSSCPMHPHCSLYGTLAFERYNPLRAFMMTADRLHRCGHDLRNYETVTVDGYFRFFDPVDPDSLVPEEEVKLYASTDSYYQAPPWIQLDRNLSSIIDVDTSRADGRLLMFADALREEKDYYRAATEYRRLMYYYPESPYWKRASRSLFDCYYLSEQYLTAIHLGKDLLNKKLTPEERRDLKFNIGASYFEVDNYPLARKYFEDIDADDTADIKSRAIMMTGLSYARQYDWQKARDAFASVNPKTDYNMNAGYCLQLAEEGLKLKKKSPTLAGILAIIPGLGYFYDGYGQTGLASMIVNGLFIWGTVEAYDRDNVGLGVTMSVLSFGWYAGNIYGSVTSAHRRNAKSENDLLMRFDVGFMW